MMPFIRKLIPGTSLGGSGLYFGTAFFERRPWFGAEQPALLAAVHLTTRSSSSIEVRPWITWAQAVLLQINHSPLRASALSLLIDGFSRIMSRIGSVRISSS